MKSTATHFVAELLNFSFKLSHGSLALKSTAKCKGVEA